MGKDFIKIRSKAGKKILKSHLVSALALSRLIGKINVARRPFQLLHYITGTSKLASDSATGSAQGGPWSPEERTMHINCLELLAAFLVFCFVCVLKT